MQCFSQKESYEGTLGTFLNLKDDDPKWADILEQNSQVRSLPVEWLQHYQPGANSDHEESKAPHTTAGWQEAVPSIHRKRSGVKWKKTGRTKAPRQQWRFPVDAK
jgi:hypothetical protein